MNKGLTIVLVGVCVAVLAVSAYNLISYYGADRAAERGFAELLPEDAWTEGATGIDGAVGVSAYDFLLPYYEELLGKNGDMVGWLRIPGTRISYPVMQTSWSPEYYLDRNFEREYSASGSLFASAICDVDKPSDVVTVYGHRMRTGAMFGSLGDYLDIDFLLENDMIIFDTFFGRHEYRIHNVFSIDVSREGHFAYYDYVDFADGAAFDGFMREVNALTEVENPAFTPVYGDKILLLSTCEYTHEDGRLVIVAVMV